MSSEHGYDSTISAIKDSLSRASLDYFDLILLHDPLAGKTKRIESYKALQTAIKEGQIKSAGVSNFGVKHLQELKKGGFVPSINQIELHPWCQQKDIVSYCQKEGIVVQAYCPLVRGDRMNDSTLVRQMPNAHSITSGRLTVMRIAFLSAEIRSRVRLKDASPSPHPVESTERLRPSAKVGYPVAHQGERRGIRL